MHVIIHAEDVFPEAAPSRLTLDGPCRLGDALQSLALPRATGLMIVVNGKLAGWDTILADGDVVELIPALGGG